MMRVLTPFYDISGLFFLLLWVGSQALLIWNAVNHSFSGVMKTSAIMLLALWGACYFEMVSMPETALIYSAIVGLVAAVCWVVFAKRVMRWKATVQVGVCWSGHEFVLCEGPRWWVNLRARIHLWANPYRVVRITPI